MTMVLVWQWWEIEWRLYGVIGGVYVRDCGDVWENEEEWDEHTLDALFQPNAEGRREQEAVEPEELTNHG